jgi:endonuclease YncB( thermonuclease family)
MPFVVIKGTFSPALGMPDGDSLRFVPDDPSPIYKLRRRGVPPKINPDNGSIQLRYEGIDALEKAVVSPFSKAALDANLQLCGLAGPVGTARGHVLSNQIGPDGRLIAFVYAGDAPEADAAEVFLDAQRLAQSVNHALAVRGLVYPLFYDTLFADLRQALAAVTRAARANGTGLWSEDRTVQGAVWTGSENTLPPIFPKLWRRIDKYVANPAYFDPARPFASLKNYIAIEEPERVFVFSQQNATGFDNVVETSDDTVRLMVEPEDLMVFSVPPDGS